MGNDNGTREENRCMYAIKTIKNNDPRPEYIKKRKGEIGKENPRKGKDNTY